MKTFTQYLYESFNDKKYSFIVKIAGDVPEHCEDVMESSLKKFEIDKFSKIRTTPIQAKLQDFPELENLEVTLYEIDLLYPTTSLVLHSYISEQTGIPSSNIKVRNRAEEDEAELNVENCNEDEEKSKALLSQPYENTDNQQLAGEKHKSLFLKNLAKQSKDAKQTQYKGVNDQLLAKKCPKESTKQKTKDEKSYSPISGKK